MNVAVKNNELKFTTVLEARRYLVGFIPAGTKIVVRKVFTFLHFTSFNLKIRLSIKLFR